jgi:hypothetical protein
MNIGSFNYNKALISLKGVIMEFKHANPKDIIKLKRWNKFFSILQWGWLKRKLVKRFIYPIVYKVVDAEMRGNVEETFNKFATYPKLTPEDIIRLEYGNKYKFN